MTGKDDDELMRRAQAMAHGMGWRDIKAANGWELVCDKCLTPAKPETCGECQSHGQRECPADTVRAESDPACDKATRRLPVVARGCITCLHNATGSQTCCDCDESDSGWQPRPAAQGVENG